MSSAPPPLAASILTDVKAALRMQRRPRNLKLFWYFLHCYKQATTTSTIGISLTGRAPNTVIIQQRLGITGAEDYMRWFTEFCTWKRGGAYNFVNGKQRELKRWTPAAHALFGKWSHLPIPYEILRSLYRETRDIPSTTSSIGISLRGPEEMRHMIDTNTDIDEDVYVDEPSPPVGIGDFRRPFYHNTSSSPNRWYHPLQSLTTAQKKAAFRGHVNVDIVSCFTSIWWFELGGKDCTLQNAWLLHPDHKAELYKLLMTDFSLTSVEEAKALRVTLTSDYKNKHRVPTGIQWFDDLHDQILSDSYKWAHYNNLQRPTVHKVFTYLEWKIIERMLTAGEEALLMHDGIIFKSVDLARLRKAAAPHKLSIERW